jgi:hypothetical protein
MMQTSFAVAMNATPVLLMGNLIAVDVLHVQKVKTLHVVKQGPQSAITPLRKRTIVHPTTILLHARNATRTKVRALFHAFLALPEVADMKKVKNKTAFF